MGIKSVYVIILNWNHKEDLLLTLRSFCKQTYTGLKIIVADNGSTDGSIESIKKDFPGITLINNKENLGFAAGNNRAIEYALSQNADFVLLANNDIFFDNCNLISQIIQDITDNKIENIGIYGIQERNYYDVNKVESNGWILFEEYQRKGKPFNIKRSEALTNLSTPYRIVDFVSGSFILIDSVVLLTCGMLDEAFFMYHEEAEFCFRAWLNKYHVVVNTSLCYYHKVAQSSGTRSPLSIYYRLRNNYYFLFKHRKNIKYFFSFLFYLTLHNLIGFLKLTISLSFKYNRNITIWRAQTRAFRDVLLRKYFKQNFLI